jgi:hypothetical protein
MITSVIAIPGRLFRRFERYCWRLRLRARYSCSEFKLVSIQCEFIIFALITAGFMLMGAFGFAEFLRGVADFKYRMSLGD